MSDRIGWIGLGELGFPMASNLLDSGYRLTVYNRTRSKAEPLGELGALIAANPSDVAAKGGLVVSVLWDSDTTESFVTPEFLSRIEGAIVEGSTVECDRERVQRLRAHGACIVQDR